MKISRLLPVVFCLLAASSALAQTSSEPTIRGELGRKLDRFLTYTEKFPDGISGAILVARNGTILLEKGYGIADSDSEARIRHDAIWDVASITKQFTAAAILKLQMQGKLSLDDPLDKIFDDVPDNKAKVTLRQLLSHTSGIKNDGRLTGVDLFDRDETVAAILELPMSSKPGEKWAYSNLAYFLLGGIIEKVSGQSYEDYVREHLFEPAGMKDAGCIGEERIDLKRVPRGTKGTSPKFAYGPKLSWGYRAAGGVLATVRDMYNWDRALRGKKLLSDALKAELYKPRKNGYALGWFVRPDAAGRRRVFHGGSVRGLNSYYLRHLDRDLVVVVLQNVNRNNSPEFVRALVGIVNGNAAPIPPEKPGRPLAGVKAYEGTYEMSNGGLMRVWRTDVGVLIGALNQKGVLALIPHVNPRGIVPSHIKLLDERAGKILDGMKDEDSEPLRDALFGDAALPPTRASDEQVEKWIKALSGGGLESFKILGNYLTDHTTSHQTVELTFKNETKHFRFVWQGNRLRSIDPAGRMMARIGLRPAGGHAFYRKIDGSWRMLRVDFDVDGGSGEAEQVTLTGQTTVTATRRRE